MKVKSAVLIQSDDMAMGVDDGSLSVPIGTEGIVIGNNGDKPIVEFKVGPFKVTHECLPKEIVPQNS